jgi:quercetin dioxygenase-like cupin family protein
MDEALTTWSQDPTLSLGTALVLVRSANAEGPAALVTPDDFPRKEGQPKAQSKRPVLVPERTDVVNVGEQPVEEKVAAFLAQVIPAASAEVMIVLESEMQFQVEGQVHYPRPGEELLIPAGAVHSARNVAGTTARWLYGYKR